MLDVLYFSKNHIRIYFIPNRLELKLIWTVIVSLFKLLRQLSMNRLKAKIVRNLLTQSLHHICSWLFNICLCSNEQWFFHHIFLHIFLFINQLSILLCYCILFVPLKLSILKLKIFTRKPCFRRLCNISTVYSHDTHLMWLIYTGNKQTLKEILNRNFERLPVY